MVSFPWRFCRVFTNVFCKERKRIGWNSEWYSICLLQTVFEKLFGLQTSFVLVLKMPLHILQSLSSWQDFQTGAIDIAKAPWWLRHVKTTERNRGQEVLKIDITRCTSPFQKRFWIFKQLLVARTTSWFQTNLSVRKREWPQGTPCTKIIWITSWRKRMISKQVVKIWWNEEWILKQAKSNDHLGPWGGGCVGKA